MFEEENIAVDEKIREALQDEDRQKLRAGLPVTERIRIIGGIPTALLEGGEGPPIILLHGPGENAYWWMRMIPQLVETHRVIVPDLPGHGATLANKDLLTSDKLWQWIDELIDQRCSEPPTLVGHVLGGSIAARYAIGHGRRIKQLVLVDSLGLGKFRPSFRFAFGLIRFMLFPSEKNFNRFFPHCMYDVDKLRNDMGVKWDAFTSYNLKCAKDADRKEALQTIMTKFGIPKIPSEDLGRIEVPTSLIWGRHDKANKLSIAERASRRYDWPLEVIDEARDDPKLERPNEFVQRLYRVMSVGESA